MAAKRSIDGNSERAFRVVEEAPTWTKYRGPYSTLAAARGVATHERKNNERWHKDQNIKIWIEQTPAGWERIE